MSTLNVNNITKYTGGEVVVNDASEDVDFRVESNDDANMLVVNAGNNSVGVGVATPSAKLEIEDGGTSLGDVLVKITIDDQSSHYGLSVGNDSHSTTDNLGLMLMQDNSGNGSIYNNGHNPLYFHSAGNVEIPAGNLVMGTSGKGIDFSAVTPTAGMTGQLLDDYEEGTWTPTLTNTGGSPSYTWQHGKYVKVGRHVWLVMNMKFTVTPSGVGQVYISGLPFANVNTAANYWPATIYPYQGCDYDGDQIFGQIPDGGTIVYISDAEPGTGGNKDTFKASNLGTTVEMEMSINYPT